MKITVVIDHIHYDKVIGKGCAAHGNGAVRLFGGLGARFLSDETKQDLTVQWIAHNQDMIVTKINAHLKSHQIVATVSTIDCIALGRNLIATATLSHVDLDAIAIKYLPFALEQHPDQALVNSVLNILAGQEYTALAGALHGLDKSTKIALLSFFINQYQNQVKQAINQIPIARELSLTIGSISLN